MGTRTITLDLPEGVYEQYRQKAEYTQRTVEDEVLEVIAEAAPDAGLPPELAKEIAAMSLYSDKALWKAARTAMPAKMLNQLKQLNYKQQKEGHDSLSEEERQLHTELGYQYDRYILLRAHAAMLLKRRGHDISSLGPKT